MLRARVVAPRASAQAPPAATSTSAIRIACRPSQLAKLQAQEVAALLRKVRPEWTEASFELVALATAGDENASAELRSLGQGAFTEAIDAAVSRGEVDVGVHSLKDVAVVLPDGVTIAACLPRDDPRDALVSLTAHTLADLPSGARVGTSSLRRKAQLLAAHPHLRVVPLRGNIDARLQALQAGELDAIVLAAAGLSRLGRADVITRVLDFGEMLPAACQGAVGVTCRAADAGLRWELGLCCHEPTRLEVAAERAILAAILMPRDAPPAEGGAALAAGPVPPGGGGHLAPVLGLSRITGLPLLPAFAVAGHAAFDPHDGSLNVDALVASPDGHALHRVRVAGSAGDPASAAEIGADAGAQLRRFADSHGWLD
ncbi:hypothetical protein HT031_000329 [Scenedesmus sp. PABB004]|nr:hypothetical protein HT031_000329 [Scenedesmus sp. PABB004]